MIFNWTYRPRYIKGCGFRYFAKNLGETFGCNYSQTLLDQAKKKRPVQNTSEKRSNFIGNKSADKTFRKPKPQPGEISAEIPEELWDNKLLINLDRYNI